MMFFIQRLQKIRFKLFLAFGSVFILVITLSFSVLYFTLKDDIEGLVEDSLSMQIKLIKNSIETSMDTAIKSYFRAMAYASYDTVESCYQKFQNGILTEIEAKKLAMSFLKSQHLGKSGYTVILNKNGIIVHHRHSENIGMDVSGTELGRAIMEGGNDTIEYEWQNPYESKARKKILHSVYFEPWEWYINVTGYEEEFFSLISLEDFEDKILSITLGETGYPLVLDLKGNLLIHPQFKGENMYNRQDSMGEVTRKAIEEKEGRTYYYWKNPGEASYRKKLTVYSEIPKFDVIVAVTFYESEILAPLDKMKKVILTALLLSLILIIYLSKAISKTMTRSIIAIKENMDKAAGGDLSVTTPVYTSDEIGEIADHFNNFLKELRDTQNKLLKEERYSNMGRLLARISHHLNTPIGNILMAVSFLKEELDKHHFSNSDAVVPAEIIESYDRISQAGAIMEKSIIKANDIIKSFKVLQRNSRDRRVQRKDLSDYLNAFTLTEWKQKLPEGIRIKLKNKAKLFIQTDFELLQFVLDNLISNSVKHSFRETPEGEIALQTAKIENGVELIYTDSGIGISSEAGEKLFQPFFSSDNSYHATGIGLTIVYYIVTEGLNGSIVYEGSLVSGIRYRILLPDLPMASG